MNRFGITPEIAQRFAGSLLHFIWQGALVGFVTAVCLKFLSKRSAELRYVIAAAAMAIMLAAPVLTFAFYGQTGAIALRLLQWTRTTHGGFTASGPLTSGSDATAVWAQWILLAWCAGVCSFLARLVMGWYLSHRMVRLSETAIPVQIRRLFDEMYGRLALSKPIRLLVQVRIDTPMVIGWLRPAVLLPISAIAGLNEEQLLGIFAHELAHIRRHDFLVNMLQRCVEAMLFYHPAVWWLSNRIRTEREDCCDDLAVRVCGNRRNYAEALVALEQKRQDRQALAVAATDGSLVHRIQRILGFESSGADWQSAAVTLLFLGIWVVAGMWHSTPLVAQPTVSLAGMSSPLSPITSNAPVKPVLTTALSSIAAIITAQPVAAQPVQTTTAGPGSIQGIVTRAGSSAPVPDARVWVTTTSAPTPKALQDFVSFFASRGVTVTPPENGQLDQKFFQQVVDAAAGRGISRVDPTVDSAFMQLEFSSRKTVIAVTDASGRFRVESLAPGRYSIGGGRDDYFNPKGADAVVVSGKTADVALSIIPGATVSGRVLNPAGRPMSNATVTAYDLSFENGLPVLHPTEEATTDDRGDYRIFWLPPGEYYIGAMPHSTLPPRTTSNIVTLSRVDQLVRTYFPGVVDALAAKELKIYGGERISGIDITMKTHPGVHRISGVITASFKTGTANVALVPADSDTPYEAWNYQNLHVGTIPLGETNSGSSSAFDIDGIVPGVYRMIVSVDEKNPDGGSGYAIGHTIVEVRDRDVTGIQLNISPTVRVNGNVSIDGHSPGKTNVKISVQADDAMIRVPVYQGLAARAVSANERDGSFMIPSVGLGHFRLQVAGRLPPEIYISDIRLGGRSVYESGFDVTSEPLGTFQVVLSSGAGAAQGIVEDASGKPLADATVVLVPDPQHRQNRSMYGTAVSNASGHFTIQGIAPGVYKLFAWEEITDGAYLNSRFLEQYESRGKSINVVPASAASATITAISREGK